VKRWLEQHFPELRGHISGGNSPVPPIVELLQKIMSLFQLLGIVCTVMGEGVFQLIGIQRTPRWYRDIVMQNGVPIMIALYLVIPQILNGYVVSGAFEVTLDGTEVIFSKIATRKMPLAEDLIAPLTKAGLTLASPP
jgi:hypothetical protein